MSSGSLRRSIARATPCATDIATAPGCLRVHKLRVQRPWQKRFTREMRSYASRIIGLSSWSRDFRLARKLCTGRMRTLSGSFERSRASHALLGALTEAVRCIDWQFDRNKMSGKKIDASILLVPAPTQLTPPQRFSLPVALASHHPMLEAFYSWTTCIAIRSSRTITPEIIGYGDLRQST